MRKPNLLGDGPIISISPWIGKCSYSHRVTQQTTQKISNKITPQFAKIKDCYNITLAIENGLERLPSDPQNHS